MRPGIEDGFARSCYAAPDRIVVATALTDLEYLASEAIAQAEAAQAELVFVHALAPGAPRVTSTYYNPLKADRDARLTLEVLSRHVRARNIACSVAVRHGHPVEVLEDFLRERPSERLIIGTRSTPDVASGSLGSITAQLLLQTPIPVCAMPPRVSQASNIKAAPELAQTESRESGSERQRTILYPVGEQGPHSEGVRFALDVAQYFHSELILLQISKDGQDATDSLPMSCQAGLWPRMRRIGCRDASVPALLNAVQEVGAEMILIEAPLSLTGGTEIPATLAELVAHAPCPVLTFPVLPLDRRHPELRVLPGLRSASAPSVGVH